MGEFAAAADAGHEMRSGLEDDLMTDGTDPYGQDDGEVSWTRPLGRVNWSIPAGVPLHSWTATALFGTAAAWKGAAMASQALALGAAQLVHSPEVAERAQAELAARTESAGRPPALTGTVAHTEPTLWTGRWPVSTS
jgi:aminobenzoyl-glutamate utilization protein B